MSAFGLQLPEKKHFAVTAIATYTETFRCSCKQLTGRVKSEDRKSTTAKPLVTDLVSCTPFRGSYVWRTWRDTRRGQATNRNGRRESTTMKTTVTQWRDLSSLVSVRISASCYHHYDPSSVSPRSSCGDNALTAALRSPAARTVFRRQLSKLTGENSTNLRSSSSTVVFDEWKTRTNYTCSLLMLW